jgi:hypothetical protein
MKREVIAKKEAGVFTVYLVVFILSLLLFGGAFVMVAMRSETPIFENLLVWIVILGGAVCLGIFGYRGVQAFKTPEIIMETDGKTLFLPNGKTVELLAVETVEFKRAKSRGFEYDYGNLIVVTATEKYAFPFVEDVAQVQKRLLALVEKVRGEATEKE